MGLLKQDIDTIESFLEVDGLNYDPLRVELVDHLICDTEQHMLGGKSFHEAWLIVKNEIPDNHLKQIESETMEMITKRPSRAHLLAYVSIGLLSLGSLFKLLHLPGAAMLIGIFFAYTCLVLFASSFYSIYTNKYAFGTKSLILVAAALSIFFAAITFKILHLPGAGVLLGASTFALPAVLIGMSIHFLVTRQKDHVLLHIINNQGVNIERAILVLIGIGYLLNMGAFLGNDAFQYGILFFIFSVVLTGVYVFANTWNHLVEAESESRFGLMISSSIALIMFFIPLIGFLFSIEFRNFMAYGSYLIMAVIVTIHYVKHSQSTNRSTLISLSILFIFYPILKLGINLDWFQGVLSDLTSNAYFNTGFLSGLIILFAVYRNETLFRLLLLLTIANFMIPSF
jgi:hypothetical protein